MLTEAYLETSQTPTMELFWENSQRLIAMNYFCKSFFVDVWLGSKYTSGSLDAPFEMALRTFLIFQNVTKTGEIVSLCSSKSCLLNIHSGNKN